MSSNAKFLFDTEFGANIPNEKKNVSEPELPPALYTEEEKETFVAQAEHAGFQRGQEEALLGIEASSTEAINLLAGQLQQMSDAHQEKMENIRCEAASLAFAIAKKMAPQLIARQPEAEVLGMIESCLADLHDEPRIVIRASEGVCSILTEKVNDLTAATGFQGNIIILPDETKLGSDCRIEWADGGVERNMDDTLQEMETIINRFVSASQETGR